MKPAFPDSAADAVSVVPDGATVFVGGFGPIGYPFNLMQALYDQGTKDLTFITNAGSSFGRRGPIDFRHFHLDGRIRRVINIGSGSSHPSRPSLLEQLVREGKVEAETVPQGTLAERIRAAAAGIPAFYTPVGVGTEIASGKEYREFDGRGYILERALHADFALVHAWQADRNGNLVFRRAARNFNPLMARAAECAIVEVEEPLLDAGQLDPDHVHVPGICVQRVIAIPADGIVKINVREWRERLLSEAQMAKRALAQDRQPR